MTSQHSLQLSASPCRMFLSIRTSFCPRFSKPYTFPLKLYKDFITNIRHSFHWWNWNINIFLEFIFSLFYCTSIELIPHPTSPHFRVYLGHWHGGKLIQHLQLLSKKSSGFLSLFIIALSALTNWYLLEGGIFLIEKGNIKATTQFVNTTNKICITKMLGSF